MFSAPALGRYRLYVEGDFFPTDRKAWMKQLLTKNAAVCQIGRGD
jgi:hypothetical protein